MTSGLRLAPLKLTAIKREAISRILSNMEKAGLAGATLNNARALVSSICSKAIEWGYAASNPVIGVKTRKKVKRDRRTCRQCSNLTYGGLCSVATPGGAVSASRGYRPAPDLLQRCAGYEAKP